MLLEIHEYCTEAFTNEGPKRNYESRRKLQNDCNIHEYAHERVYIIKREEKAVR